MCTSEPAPRAQGGVLGRGPSGQEVLHGAGLEWPCEQVALATVAVLALELGVLLGLLDPLGQGLETEGLAQLDQGADQRPGLGRVGHGGDERAVDLEGVDGELLEIGQRGVAGAEVVDGDADPGRLERRPAGARRRPRSS